MDINIVNNEKKFLAGELEGYNLKGAENKFDDKGNPLPFPGCTIICNIPLNTYLSNLINSFQKKLENFTYYNGWIGASPIGNENLNKYKYKKIFFDIIYK